MVIGINLCNKCPSDIRGLCCYHSYYDGQDNFILFPCEYLSKKTRRCTVYKKRFKKKKGCLTVDDMLKQGACPKGCLYVKESFTPKYPYKTINKKKRDEIIWKLKKKI